MTLTTIVCRPDGTQNAPRIPPGLWETVRPALESWHKQGITRKVMRQRLRDEYNFHPTPGQLQSKMTGWGYAIYGPKKTSVNKTGSGSRTESETAPARDNEPVSDVSYIELVYSPAPPVSHCANTCCLATMQCQARLLAVGFLCALSCYQMAYEIFAGVWSDISSDASIPLSDKVWMMMWHGSMIGLENGITLMRTVPMSLFDPQVAQCLSQHITALGEIRPPREDSLPVGCYFYSTITSNFWLLCQYRRVGTLAPSSLCERSPPSSLPRSEVLEWESKTSLLNRLMIWCLRSMDDSILIKMLQNVAVDYGVCPLSNEDHLDSALEIPPSAISLILACHYMQTWIDKPDEAIVDSMQMLRRYACSALDLEVLLPEAFATIARICLREVYGIATTPLRVDKSLEEAVPSGQVEQVLHILNELRNGMTRMCRKDAGDYVYSFVDELVSSDLDVAQVLKPSITLLAASTTQKIMQSRTPTESNPAQLATKMRWMRVPDCFELESRIKDHLEPISRSYEQIWPSRNPSLLQRSRSVRVKRNATSSSTSSMQAQSSRTEAELARQAAGVTRELSNASQMSCQTDHSFDLVARFGRSESTASKFSFTMQDVITLETQEFVKIQDDFAHGDDDAVVEKLAECSLVPSRSKQLKSIPESHKDVLLNIKEIGAMDSTFFVG
ncbi:hypothetical protein H2198_000031 [Neophaeococcomyces mojaviensis]|uniref:Uncharacterized protein n=1 Tax=Neophaeococcomyces mojaviensis TaxID=3383035 RepID=A0ACC3AL18_9EURO|nr:hypothetical protein H2198_000031 [Knufia sp. JES_112]